MMKVKETKIPDLETIREHQNMADDLFTTPEDINYMNTFIEYPTMKLQKDISKKLIRKRKQEKQLKQL
jgi:hypothetical protein